VYARTLKRGVRFCFAMIDFYAHPRRATQPKLRTCASQTGLPS
jgi:hypothetical protein